LFPEDTIPSLATHNNYTTDNGCNMVDSSSAHNNFTCPSWRLSCIASKFLCLMCCWFDDVTYLTNFFDWIWWILSTKEWFTLGITCLVSLQLPRFLYVPLKLSNKQRQLQVSTVIGVCFKRLDVLVIWFECTNCHDYFPLNIPIHQ
jgi:hypothetical protein